MLNVSKWVKLPLLVDSSEMENLFAVLPPFQLYSVQKVTARGEGIVAQDAFLRDYARYIEILKRGGIPERTFGPIFSLALSVTEEAFFAMLVEGERQLYKPTLPVVQMQAHAVRYSSADKSFRSQLFGSDGISWGIQLGYPQIYQDPKTDAIFATRDLPNGALFHAIQKWVRSNTSPTPFVADGVKQNVPIRLGKECFSWINSHPQLKQGGISVVARTADTQTLCS